MFSSLILHAGDIEKPEVLQQLEEIAPVSAIQGNVDKGSWAEKLPHTKVVKYNETYIYMLHNLNDLNLEPKTAGFDAVISGHSHKPAEEWQDGVLFLNPGSAGPRRFNLPVSVATLEINNKGITVHRIDLLCSTDKNQ